MTLTTFMGGCRGEREGGRAVPAGRDNGWAGAGSLSVILDRRLGYPVAPGELVDRLVFRVALPDSLVLLHLLVEALGDPFRTNRTVVWFGEHLSGVDQRDASGDPLLSLSGLAGP
jgi:hypothetical protein